MIRNSIYGIVAIVLVGICYFSSCTYDQLPAPVEPEFCDTANVTYNDQIKPIIDRNCTYSGCHDGSQSFGNYTNYEGMLGWINNGEIKERVIDFKDDETIGMPPSYVPAGEPQDLTDAELELMACWILQGYKEE